MVCPVDLSQSILFPAFCLKLSLVFLKFCSWSVLFFIYVNDRIVAVKKQKPSVCCHLCYTESFNAKKISSPSQDGDGLVALADDNTICTVVGTESEMPTKLVNLFERVVLWFDANFVALYVARSSF